MPTKGGAADIGASTEAERMLHYVLDHKVAPMPYPPVEIFGTIKAGGDFPGSFAAAGQARHQHSTTHHPISPE